MKKTILLLNIVLLCITSYSQNPYEYLMNESSQIVFEKVYNLDSLNSNDIEILLTASTFKDVSDIEKMQDVIRGKIKNVLIDYKKYGYTWANTANYVKYPFYADVLMVWKNGKYKVTVNNMRFEIPSIGMMNAFSMTCSEALIKKKTGELETKKIIVDSGIIIEKYLSDIFIVSNIQKKEW